MIDTYNYLKIKIIWGMKNTMKNMRERKKDSKLGVKFGTYFSKGWFKKRKKIVQIRKGLITSQKKMEESVKTRGYKRRNADVQYT